MVRKEKFKPTEAELEILQILWENGPSTVREVNERMNAEREVGYTTTLKLMQIMTEKGMTGRNTDKRTHIYFACVDEGETKNWLLDKFLKSAFRGSAAQLVMQALGNHDASNEELEKIKQFIDSMSKRD